jgi:hypothetical protein
LVGTRTEPRKADRNSTTDRFVLPEVTVRAEEEDVLFLVRRFPRSHLCAVEVDLTAESVSFDRNRRHSCVTFISADSSNVPEICLTHRVLKLSNANIVSY